MLQEKNEVTQENRTGILSARSCFACGPDNPRGLRLVFQTNKNGDMTAEWIPEPEMEGYQGIVHGGIVSTVLDEAMAKVVDATGAEALTAELRVRFRQQVSSGSPVRVRGWIESRNKRVINAEAALIGAAGAELAHAWAVFLAVKQEGSPVVAKEL
ncbi:MAG TPA: PaaI family thioesterase [Terracidiphilus sp.]|nr:PaaI family thioesterase [Terracidiphilus sp.]